MKDGMLTLHFIGLAMGLGSSFARMFLGIASAKMEKSEALRFNLQLSALTRMGHTGLGLLVVSGLFLMQPYWDLLSEMPLLIAKLILVLVLTALVGILSAQARKARSGDAEAIFKKLEPLGKLTLLTAVAIVVLAVLNFH